MKKLLSFFIALILTLTIGFSQTSISHSSDTLKLNVEIKATDVKLPIQDVGSIYSQINELKSSNKTEYDALLSKIDLLSVKVDNIIHKESEAKVEYIASSFDMTKDDISMAIKKRNRNASIAIILPLIILAWLWSKVFRFRHLVAMEAFVFVLLGIFLSGVTGLGIYVLLQSLFNSNYAILNQLQNLL